MITFYSLKFNKLFKLIFITLLFAQLTSCGLYKPTDARKVSPNADERVKQNQKEGKGLRLGNLGRSKGGDFQFASSNEMWRATLDILDFVPLNNADYGGGIIITDWYSDNTSNNESIKISLRFLGNDIRSESLKVIVHKKTCKTNEGR